MRTKRAIHIVQYKATAWPFLGESSVSGGAPLVKVSGAEPPVTVVSKTANVIQTDIQPDPKAVNPDELWLDLTGSECFDLGQAEKKAEVFAKASPGAVCRVVRLWPSITCQAVVTNKIVVVPDSKPRPPAQPADKKPKAKAKKAAAPPPSVPTPTLQPTLTPSPALPSGVKIKEPPKAAPVSKAPEAPKPSVAAVEPPKPESVAVSAAPKAAPAAAPANAKAEPPKAAPASAAPKAAGDAKGDFDALFGDKGKPAAKAGSPPDGELF